MTTMPPVHLRLTTVDTEDTVRIELQGDLDYDNADDLVAAITAQLDEHPRLHDLHLHCAGLDSVDTMGLSALLMTRRLTSAAGVRLHLDDRSAQLERLLTVTGSLGHLTAPPVGAEDSPVGPVEPLVTSGEAMTSRSPGPDGTT